MTRAPRAFVCYGIEGCSRSVLLVLRFERLQHFFMMGAVKEKNVLVPVYLKDKIKVKSRTIEH